MRITLTRRIHVFAVATSVVMITATAGASDGNRVRAGLWNDPVTDRVVAPPVQLNLAGQGAGLMLNLAMAQAAPPSSGATRTNGSTSANAAGASPAASAPAAGGSNAAELAKKLSNPIAALISVPFQFNYDDGFGPKDAGKVVVNIQPVIPFSISDDWNLISRTILPVIYQESLADGIDSTFGIGDVVQSLFFSPKEPVGDGPSSGGWIVGFGPVALLPTGTSKAIRSENLGLGPTAVFLKQERGWTYGALVNHIWSLYKSDGAASVNATFLQPFVGYTWPTATTLNFSTESTYDWTAEEWNVPLVLTLGQVFKIGNQPVSLQAGPKWYPHSPPGGAEWGFRVNFTLLFPR